MTTTINLRFAIVTDEVNSLRMHFDAEFSVYRDGNWRINSARCERIAINGEHCFAESFVPDQSKDWTFWLERTWEYIKGVGCNSEPHVHLYDSRRRLKTEHASSLTDELMRLREQANEPDHGGDADRWYDRLRTVGSIG